MSHELIWDLFSIAAALIGIVGTVVTVIAVEKWSLRKKWFVGALCVISITAICTIRIAEERLRIVSGTFEWQWTGENWYGRVEIGEDVRGEKTVAVKVKSLVKHPTGRVELSSKPVLWSLADGRLYGSKRGFRFEVPIVKTVGGRETRVHLEGELYPVEAYAGIVTYKGQRLPGETGDMVIVRYRSAVQVW